MKGILSTIVGLVVTTIPAVLAGITNPVAHAVVAGVGVVLGVVVHHQVTSTKLWNGNPFGSVTVASVLMAVFAFIAAHFDPSQLTALGSAVWGILGGVIGALTHHAVTLPGATD